MINIGLTNRQSKADIVNPRRACAARVTVLGLCVCVSVCLCVCLSVCLSVCVSVCLSVTTFSATTCNETAKKRYQRVQCHNGFIFKMAILIKMLRSKVMA